MVNRVSFAVFLALGLLATAVFSQPTDAKPIASSTYTQPAGVIETYTGTIVGVGGTLGGKTWNFTMKVDGYNSRGEALEYSQLLQADGQDALLKAIQRKKLGTFSVAGQVGRDLNFVYATEGENGRRIIALFDRWESIWERRQGTRTLDYPFTYIELSIDSNGKGSGTIIPLAKVYFDKKDANLINIENFGVYPLRLVEVERS